MASRLFRRCVTNRCATVHNKALAMADGGGDTPLIASLIVRWFKQIFSVWSKNVSRETFSAPIFVFSAFSVLVALLGGRQYKQNASFLLNQ